MFPFASLPENLAAFCDRLRHDLGFSLGPGEVRDAARTLDMVPLGDARAVRNALRPILCSSPADIERFDAAFSAFFLGGPGSIGRALHRRDRDEPERGRVRKKTSHPSRPEAGAGDDATAASGARAVLLGEVDDRTPEAGNARPQRGRWSPLDGDSGAAGLGRPHQGWRDAARVLVRRVQAGRARRWRPGRRGQRFDLRRTLRRSLQTGGEALSPRWLARPRRNPRFVVIIDGSRSMDVASHTALSFAVAMTSVWPRVETFVFSTALQRVTADVRAAVRGEASRPDHWRHAWGGGTSIGRCLRTFIRTYGDRYLGPNVVVIVASDGLDLGEPDVLREAMAELRRRSAALVWLNPLAATSGYEPTALGMRVALPYVAAFASGDQPSSVARMARTLRLRA